VKLDASGTTGSGSDQGHWQVGGTCPTFGSRLGATTTSSSRLCLAGDLGGVVPFGLLIVGTDTTTPTTNGPVSIEAVREDGRWFVSPVSTALDIVDSTIQHVDEKSIYPLIGLGYLLPPESTITLDQPFGVASSGFYHVYAFDGTKGQSVLGEVEGGSNAFASARLYTADGHDVGYLDFSPKDAGWGASPLTLPATGSYRLVVSGGVSKNATLTLFDTAHAPKSLTNPSPGSFGGNQTCTSTPGGGEKCAVSMTPITAYPPNLPPATTVYPSNGVKAPSMASGCRQTASGVMCVSTGSKSAVATTSLP